MNSVYFAIGEIGVATTASSIVATTASFDPLITALVSFGVSVITIVGGEVIKFLVAFFKKKTNDIENSNNKKE